MDGLVVAHVEILGRLRVLLRADRGYLAVGLALGLGLLSCVIVLRV